MELGYRDKAIGYLRYAIWIELADVHANVDQGCHIASMGGTWMAIVYGIAGMRDQNGRISFKPRLGKGIEGLRFHLVIQGQLLMVDIAGRSGQIPIFSARGTGLTIGHMEEELPLDLGKPVSREFKFQSLTETRDSAA